MKPSIQARLELLESGIKIKKHVNSFPIDLPSCICQVFTTSLKDADTVLIPLVKSSKDKYLDCPKSKEKGYRRYGVYCTNCNSYLAYFFNKRAKLDDDYCNLHYVSSYDKNSWYGCLGVNRDPHTMEIRFECCCENRSVDDKFTVVKIKRDDK